MLKFDLLTQSPGSEGMGVCGQNICHNVAAFAIPFNLKCKMKKLNFDPTPRVGAVGVWGKKGATMLLHA